MKGNDWTQVLKGNDWVKPLTSLISCAILKLSGWHGFLFSPFDNSWYAFPPHLNQYISLDVKVPGLLAVIRGQMWKT